MSKSSKLKIVGLTLAGLSVLASGSALAASLKVGGHVRTDFAWFDDEPSHPQHGLGYGAGNLSFDNGSNVTGADIYLRGTLMDRWVYNLSVSHNARLGRSFSSEDDLGIAAVARASDDPRFGGPFVLDAWLGWDKFDPYARFSVGRMLAYQGFENSGNRSALTFIAPAAAQSSFATGRVDGFAVEGNPFRWWGYQAGVYFHTTGSSAAGAAPGTGADVDSRSQVVTSNAGNHLSMFSGRTFIQPIVQPGRVLHVGGTYSFVDTDGDVSLNAAPGGYFNNANAQMLRLSSAAGAAVSRDGVGAENSNGVTRTDGYTLWGVEGLVVWGPFHVQAEYQDFDLDLVNLAKLSGNANQLLKNNQAAGTLSVTNNVEASGWYVQGSWLLTGESRNYDPVSGTLGKVNPRNAKWGAWELAFRYDQVNFDDTVNKTGVSTATTATTAGTATTWCGDRNSSATSTGGATGCTNGGEMSDWTVGLNWYPNKNVKLMLNYTNAEATYAKQDTTITASTLNQGPNFNAAGKPNRNYHKRDVDIVAFAGQVDF